MSKDWEMFWGRYTVATNKEVNLLWIVDLESIVFRSTNIPSALNAHLLNDWNITPVKTTT